MQFGIIHVRFADGTEWRYDLKKERSFHEDTQLREYACGPEWDQKEKEATSRRRQ
jgi:hypothetical protein